MILDWQRLWGSIATAAYFTLLVSGGALIRGDVGVVIAILGTMVIVAVVFYRAWPALQEQWARRQRVEGRHPLQPSLERVLGTLLIAAGMTLVFYATVQLVIDQLLGDGSPRDAWDRVRTFLIFLMPGYAIWPSVESKLRG
jgi:hypothetical protein